MTRENVWKMMSGTSYDGYGAHELLVSMECVFEDDDDYETDVVFAVPIDWLCDYKEKENGRAWDFGDIKDWLCNTYTSEDSQQVLESAIMEDKVAFWTLN